MEAFLKNTKTLIDSLMVTIPQSIARTKPKGQWLKSIAYRVLSIKLLLQIFFLFSSFILYTLYFIPYTYAISDPRTVTNNQFGVHIISPVTSELDSAQAFINSQGGNWGYITVVMQDNDRDVSKWQQFFNELRKRHLIPIVRLATHPDGSVWSVPNANRAQDWANFLDQLNWPIKNRYITIYNEPNQGAEWGGSADAASYATTLDQTITALKNKNQDFFVMNAGFDASAPEKAPLYKDELTFLKTMDQTVPGIFNKLDGWVSHSYPNPGFIGSPDGTGRGSVNTWQWELDELKNIGMNKDLPVFITETGWKHAEGLTPNSSYPSADQVATYYKQAFETAWNNPQIIAVTPFILNYQQPPFDHFSFKKITGEIQAPAVLGAQFPGDPNPDFYTPYTTLKNMPKKAGQPDQIYRATITKGEVYSSVIAGQSYKTQITFKNTGEAIWNDDTLVSLKATQGGQELGIITSSIPKDAKIEPGQEYTFTVEFKAPQAGTYSVGLNLFYNDKPFQNDPITFNTEVKSPVMIQVKSALKWKDDFSGSYVLSLIGPISETIDVMLNKDGTSPMTENRQLLPDYSYQFTLKKPFYQQKTITQTLKSGVNILDFGVLEPDLFSALLNPRELWRLLPW